MTPTLIAFVASFVGGPLICALALRLPPRRAVIAALAAAMVAMTLVALWSRAGHLAVSLTALWLSWVLAVAMFAQALRSQITAKNPRRWIAILAILATTLPWFGLALAQTITP